MSLANNSLLSRFANRVIEKEPLVIVENLGIKYEGEKEKRSDFRSTVHDFVLFRRNNADPFWALQNVSFTGYAGDILGVIGANGSGKSTLCRSVLGLLKPDTGNISTYGEISSLLSLGTGFNEDLSGHENIILNGLMLGISRKKLMRRLPEIEEFTGLGHFLKQPIKHYSAGMRARLGFSIVAALEPDIMVIDEVLGTGDLEFNERAVNRMFELVGQAKTVIVVTHDLDFVEENCNRAIWLHEGKLKAVGPSPEIADAYRQEVSVHSKSSKKIVSVNKTNAETGKNKTVSVNNLGIKFKVGREPFWALKNINFELHDKEILGVIGPNGAGKTTLCRTLSGLYRPDCGSVGVNGDITALLSFNLGFNSQLSGYDNIYLNGLMMGIPKQEIARIVNDIIEFAGLGNVIYKPVKKYSRGMKSRLGFSIASMLKPDVLIVDEALTTGDMTFRAKATERMQQMLEDAGTVILVTHSLGIVEKACTRAIWLEQGNIRYDGDPIEAVNLYREATKAYSNMKKILSSRKNACLDQAVKYIKNGEYVMSANLVKEYLKLVPDDAEVEEHLEILNHSIKS